MVLAEVVALAFWPLLVAEVALVSLDDDGALAAGAWSLVIAPEFIEPDVPDVLEPVLGEDMLPEAPDVEPLGWLVDWA